MKNLNYLRRVKRWALLFFCFGLSGVIFADPPIDRNFLKLPDGRWIWLKKYHSTSTEIILGKGNKTKDRKNYIWTKIFEYNGERTWDYAYFNYLKPKKFLMDLDHDGFNEVAIATYDLGTGMIRPVALFSIKTNELVYLHDTNPINLSLDEPVFKK